jgi:protein TonB
MMQFIHDYLVYPNNARENNKQGKVVVKFIVNEDGSISDITTINNPAIGFGLEEAAMNVVRKMPKWKPGRQNGKPVKVYFTLPISFKLN